MSLTAIVRHEEAGGSVAPVAEAGRRVLLPFESGAGLSIDLPLVNPSATEDTIMSFRRWVSQVRCSHRAPRFRCRAANGGGWLCRWELAEQGCC